jgi:hypothetical protein
MSELGQKRRFDPSDMVDLRRRKQKSRPKAASQFKPDELMSAFATHFGHCFER